MGIIVLIQFDLLMLIHISFVIDPRIRYSNYFVEKYTVSEKSILNVLYFGKKNQRLWIALVPTLISLFLAAVYITLWIYEIINDTQLSVEKVGFLIIVVEVVLAGLYKIVIHIMNRKKL